MTAKRKVKTRVKSIEQLIHLADIGALVTCPESQIFCKPRKASVIMGSSARSLVSFIKKGVYTSEQFDEQDDPNTILEAVQSKILELGLSYQDVAEIVGVTRQEVGRILSSKSVQTRTLERYLKKLGLKVSVK